MVEELFRQDAYIREADATVTAVEERGVRLDCSIFYPTGGGTGLLGMWKAFSELQQLGWLDEERRPRMFACQAEGCAPVVRAFAQGQR